MSDANAQYTPDVADDTYKSRTGQNEIPVQSDNAPVNDPIDADTANSDEQLVRDDQDAIDKSNIIEDRTRGAAKESYAEPGDEEGLPGPEDGTSSGRQ
ncbi:hypothetical protein BU16DRAFT_557080 [Lophium mytilinum]|uniref:Histone chaperone domain-containing protein n=1 Tax=Lophium mytilinum TaxID=390894 RepID=A0A6A6R893_9PEZI|nr:hypothetical protein BU16DRAFT_557080 [Lophium mytilinum]